MHLILQAGQLTDCLTEDTNRITIICPTHSQPMILDQFQLDLIP